MRVGEERENHLNMFGMIELDFCVNHLVNAFFAHLSVYIYHTSTAHWKKIKHHKIQCSFHFCMFFFSKNEWWNDKSDCSSTASFFIITFHDFFTGNRNCILEDKNKLCGLRSLHFHATKN